LVPATDSGDDFVRIGFPDERFGIAIMFADKAIDGGLQIDDGMKDAIFQTPAGQLGKEALDGIEP
jgi:hypothetical protein